MGRILALSALVLVVGCVEGDAVQCDGYVCPAGTVCDEANGGCVLAAQLQGCTADTEGMTCNIGGAPTGVCSKSVCVLARCGDGVVTGAEQCDGANLGTRPNADSCTLGHGFYEGTTVTCNADCTYNLSNCTRICGDGIKDPEEICDGSALGPDTCQTLGFYEGTMPACNGACQYDTSTCSRKCGDGVKDPEEACDGGLLGQLTTCQQLGYYAGGSIACTPACQYDVTSCSRRCGDGVKDPEEACDGSQLGSETCQQLGFYDGTSLGCSAACQYDTSACDRRCGDGVQDPEEACDGTDFGPITTCQQAGFYAGNALTCNIACQLDTSTCSQKCGDGIRNGGEQCDGLDLGAATCQTVGFYNAAGLACTEACVFDTTDCVRRCGDNVADPEEACDGTDLGDATTCQDLGFYDGTNLSCNVACQHDDAACSRFCGDEVKDPEELCDGGPPEESCLDFGYDAGFLSCFPLACTGDISDCKRFNWQRMSLGVPEAVVSLFAISDRIYGGMTEGKFMTYRNGAPTVEMVDTVDEGWFLSVWASDANNVFGATEGAVYRYNGTAWTRTPMPPGEDIEGKLWGTGPNNVYLFTYNPDVGTWRWNGSVWARDNTVQAFGGVRGAWGSGSDIYVLEDFNSLWHFNGSTWTDIGASVPVANMQALGGFGNTLFVAGNDNNGRHRVARKVGAGAWQTYDLIDMIQFGSLFSMYGVYARAANDVWVGAADYAYHFDGSAWTIAKLPSRITTFAAVGTEVLAGGVDASGVGGQYRLRGTSLHDLLAVIPGTFSSNQMIGTTRSRASWAASTNNIWVASEPQNGQAIVQHFDGVAWTLDEQGARNFNDMWGISPTEIYAAARGSGVLRYTGPVAMAPDWPVDPVWTGGFFDDVWGVWGTGTNIWAVGNKIWKRGAASWATELTVSNATLYDIHGRSATDVWAVGSGGRVYHYTGTWVQIPVPTTEDLHAVWTAPGADVLIVGASGTVLRWNGSQWQLLNKTPFTLRGVFGHAQNDVFAVGDSSTVLHFDGVNWAPVDVGGGEPLIDVIGTGTVTMFLGGNDGAGPLAAYQLNRLVPW